MAHDIYEAAERFFDGMAFWKIPLAVIWYSIAWVLWVWVLVSELRGDA